MRPGSLTLPRTPPHQLINYPHLHQGSWRVMPARWLSRQLNITDTAQGNGAGYLSVTGNMQKANPCELSIFNFGSACISPSPNIFPLRVKKDAQMLKPAGEATRIPFAEGSPGAHATGAAEYPKSH